jgi:uncharacterized protein YndB with AHSA1/START domain
MTREELGTIERHGDRYTLRLSRVIAAPLDRVWRAISDPDEIVKWLLAETTNDAEVGGQMKLDWENGDRSGGTILAYDPPRLVEYEWDTYPARPARSSVVRFELVEVTGGTQLLLTHRDLSPPAAPGTAAGWHSHLDKLEAVLAAVELDWRGRFDELEPRYEAHIATMAD